MSTAQIVVGGEQVGCGGVTEHHAFLRVDYIADERFGAGNSRDRLLAQRDFDLTAARPRLRLDQIFFPCREYQKAAIRARVLERDRHQPIDQLRQIDLARQTLRRLDSACQHICAGKTGI